MRTSELDYDLPPELIAQRPLPRRDDSRLLVHDRATGETRHRRFRDLPEELPRGALVVVNDTRVVPARLRVRRPTGGEAEVLLLEPAGDGLWEALARPTITVTGHGARKVVVVLDPSASMQTRDIPPSRFAQAKAEAAALVSRLGEGAEVMVIEAGVQPKVVAAFSRERERALGAISAAQAKDMPRVVEH